MPTIQMVCDSTPLVSAAIRDSLAATTAGNGRPAATGATTASSSTTAAASFSVLNHNGVNGSSGGPSGTPTTSSSSSLSTANGGVGGGKLFRRAMLESSNYGNDDEQLEDADGANDLVETISQSLRQGQQVKPIAYEEGPSYSASLDKLKSKYIVLKATAPQSDEAGGGEAGAGGPSSGGCPPNGATAGQQMHHPSPKLSSMTTAGGMMGKIPTAVAGQAMNGGGGSGPLKYGASGTPHKLAPTGRPTNHNGVGTGSSATGKDGASLPAPKRTLFPRENVQVGWKTTGRKWQVGAGMINMGNTCYLNSTLQALFHVPAIANWLVSDVQHRARCDDGGSGGSCIICAMAKTLLDSQSNQSAIKPHLVYSKLRLVCKHLVPGRQEDAHEFLRYLVEAMEKSFLGRYKNSKELDQYSKETTPLNQILGGYLRSEVKCLSCHHISTTFQHFEDLLLDIRRANSIDEALKLYFDRERLEELSYNCEACKKRVAATKQFSLERAPFVLCVQLKRFTINGTKINKHVELRSQLDLTPYSSSSSQQQQQRTSGSSSAGKLTYRLTSMVTHLGTSQHCGHYTAIGQTEGGAYHVFDDSSVRPVGMHNVMSTNAYILFYELDSPAGAAVGLLNGTTKANQIAGHPSSTVTLSSMGALANGNVPLASGNASAGASAGATAGGGGGGSTGTPRKGTHNSSPSPLRVLGSGNGSTGSAAGGLFPSKLDTKPGFIGPVLPSSSSTSGNNPSNQAGTSPATTVTAATSSSTKGGTPGLQGTTIGATGTSRPGSSASSCISSLSPPSTAGTPSSSPIKSVINSPLSHPNKIHLKTSQSTTQSPTVGGGQAPNTAKLNGIGSKQSSQVAAATATQLPSLPKLSLGPINNGSSRPGNSKPVTVVANGGTNSISLVPYETDDDSDNANNSSSEEEEQHQTCTAVSAGTKRAKQQQHQQNGKLVLKRRSSDEDDDDDEDDDGDRHSHSPQIIKTTAGAWKVSKSSENDKPTYPESSSSSSGSSSESAGSSKESSPVASPAQQHMLATNGGTSNNGNKNGHRNGVKSRSSSPPNAAAAAASSAGNGSTSSDTGPSAVQLLLKYSHRGYGAPVKSWGGQQTEMDRELVNERREERKRQLADDRETEMDRGRTKKVKNLGVAGAGTNGSHQHQHGNQFQHFQNYQNGGGMKWNGNRNGNQQQYGNHNHNYHRGGGAGGGYYHGGGHRQGFRNGNGGRRFGGRNGGGFHAKAHHHHHHHYRSEASSGGGNMASSSSSGAGAGGSSNSNGFYHR
ncbi:ubiquitin carboxyl-terminal hydrolase 36 isoform X1 [Anopheles darlingi]|uniref:ubiquitin carboxyl-terminal hydrolase 36 isoform X1 n=1 Tax=Anopheles darlingi TaxID=43151 RepID=UPI0021003FD8|nr:ubiquitin carboxyl-terminal hydrolase 36 isoform X1 [Anopheles darlingi]